MIRNLRQASVTKFEAMWDRVLTKPNQTSNESKGHLKNILVEDMLLIEQGEKLKMDENEQSWKKVLCYWAHKHTHGVTTRKKKSKGAEITLKEITAETQKITRPI